MLAYIIYYIHSCTSYTLYVLFIAIRVAACSKSVALDVYIHWGDLILKAIYIVPDGPKKNH